MSVDEMINEINNIRESNCMRNGMDNEYADKIIAAINAGERMADTIASFLDLESSAERGCLATYVDLKQSKEAWDAATVLISERIYNNLEDRAINGVKK